MTALGPVPAALTADLREQARQLGILVWLDKEGAYTARSSAAAPRGHSIHPFPANQRADSCALALTLSKMGIAKLSRRSRSPGALAAR